MDVAGWTDSRTEADLRSAGSLKWTAAAPGVLAAWVAEMDLPTAPVITRALTDAAGRGLTGYLPDVLAGELARATASWQRRFGWVVDPADVHPVSSVLTGLRIVLERLTDRSGPVVVPTPAYMPFLTVPALAGRELVTVPMSLDGDRYSMDLDAIAAALRPTRSASPAVFVLTNPHNPTGRVFGPAELLALAEVVDRAGATVFADEIHSPVVFPGHTHRPYAGLCPLAAAHTITGTSASKGWNVAGLGCAQLILSSDEGRERWLGIDPVAWLGATPLGAVASVAAYLDGTDHLAAVVDYLRVGRDLFAERVASTLPAARLLPLEGTYLGWLDLRETGCDPVDVEARAKVRGVDGRACGTPGFLRLNLALPHHLLIEMANRLAACG